VSNIDGLVEMVLNCEGVLFFKNKDIDGILSVIKHFENPENVLHDMKKHVSNKLAELKPNELLPCMSAFNGFAIYKTIAFKNCVYDGNIRLDLIPNHYLKENMIKNNSKIVFKDHNWLNSKKEDCEHRSFHIQAILRNKAKIRISPEILY
jgi:hypothetical protein